MAKGNIKETDLYAPIKRLLEGQGYVVKGEVGAADVMACRDDEDPIIVELKTSFSLSLFHQAIERQAISDVVYVAVPRGSGRPFQKSLANNLMLCRRLGIGLMTVRLKDGLVEIHVDPAPYRPRKSKRNECATSERVCQTGWRSEYRRCNAERTDDGLSSGCTTMCRHVA